MFVIGLVRERLGRHRAPRHHQQTSRALRFPLVGIAAVLLLLAWLAAAKARDLSIQRDPGLDPIGRGSPEASD